MIRKYKAFIIKRIHLSKPSIKHTSTKAIITLFSFNITQNYFFYDKFTELNKYTNKRILKRSQDLFKKKIEKIRILLLPLYRQGKISKSQAQNQLIKAYAGAASPEQGISDKKAILFLKKVQGAVLAKQPLRLLNPTAKGGSGGEGGSFASAAKPAGGLCSPAIRGEFFPQAISPQLRSKQPQKKELILFKYKLLNQLVKNFNFYLKIYFYLIKMKKYTKIKRLYYNKLTLKYRRCQYRYYIYKYKFEKTKFLPILTKLLNKFMNKKIEIRIFQIFYSKNGYTL